MLGVPAVVLVVVDPPAERDTVDGSDAPSIKPMPPSSCSSIDPPWATSALADRSRSRSSQSRSGAAAASGSTIPSTSRCRTPATVAWNASTETTGCLLGATSNRTETSPVCRLGGAEASRARCSLSQLPSVPRQAPATMTSANVSRIPRRRAREVRRFDEAAVVNQETS